MAMSAAMTDGAHGHFDALLLLGPTASGKSALAMRLATQVPLEIVSIDSAQVYRGMDIGTAKPSMQERHAVPHHLLDIRDPSQPYSAAEFVHDATAAIADIRARGRLPLVVGGTMLYAKALRDGLSRLPSADPQLRAHIEARAAALGWPALHAELAQRDPVTAARLSPNDGQRIQQAAPSSLRLRTVGLMPADRAALRARIAQRFDAMLAGGLLDEVRALIARGDLHRDLPSQRSVGYRQGWAHLLGEIDAAQFRLQAIHATNQLAKRQMTWLRSMRDATLIDPDAASTADALAAVRRALN
jgi:tRNA dimethylallyltransferase